MPGSSVCGSAAKCSEVKALIGQARAFRRNLGPCSSSASGNSTRRCQARVWPTAQIHLSRNSRVLRGTRWLDRPASA